MKKSANLLLSLFVLIVLVVPTFGQGNSPFDPNVLLIKFSGNASNAQINQLKQTYGAVEVDVSPVTDVRKWHIASFPTPPPSQFSNINEVIQHANAQPEVTGSGLNYETAFAPTQVPGNTIGWTSTGFCRFPLIVNNGEESVKVAVMDTGVNWGCSDISPYFDAAYPGYDYVNYDPYPMDDNGHGTHIAGIIAKMANLAGNAPLKLVAYKTHNAVGKGDIHSIIKAIDRAILDGANIINMSFTYNAHNGSGTLIAGAYEPNLIPGGANLIPSGPKVAPLQAAIEMAAAQRILVVAAAGNLGQNNDAVIHPAYPASFLCPNILSVASVSCSATLSSFSSWGMNSIDIAAPGELIASNDLNCQAALKNGTSQATAMVTGVAFQLGTHFESEPFHYDRVKCAIVNSATFTPGLVYKVLSSGTINATDALTEFLQSDGCMDKKSSRVPVTTKLNAKQGTLNQSVLELSPNPFTAALKIRFTGIPGEITQLSIFDAQSKLILERAVFTDDFNGEFIWEPQGVNPGFYTIRLQNAETLQTCKAVLLR